jgi:hypothetical protein
MSDLSTEERNEIISELWEEPATETGLEYSQEQQDIVPPEIQKILDEQNQKLANLDKLEQRLKSAEGRIGSVQNTLQAAKAAPDVPSQSQIQKASRNEKAWQELKEEFPEFAEELDKTLGSTQSAFESLNQRISNLADSNKLSEVRAELEQEFNMKLLGLQHKDWKTVVQSSEYAQWINEQDEQFRDKALNSRDPLECIEILDKYKQRTKTVKDLRQERLHRSAATPQRAAKDAGELSDEDYRNSIIKKLWGNTK